MNLIVHCSQCCYINPMIQLRERKKEKQKEIQGTEQKNAEKPFEYELSMSI